MLNLPNSHIISHSPRIHVHAVDAGVQEESSAAAALQMARLSAASEMVAKQKQQITLYQLLWFNHITSTMLPAIYDYPYFQQVWPLMTMASLISSGSRNLSGGGGGRHR